MAVDTTILDQMFPESPVEADLEICDKVIYALRAKGTMYEAQAWRDCADCLIKEERFKKFSDHFSKLADRIEKKQAKSKKEI